MKTEQKKIKRSPKRSSKVLTSIDYDYHQLNLRRIQLCDQAIEYMLKDDVVSEGHRYSRYDELAPMMMRYLSDMGMNVTTKMHPHEMKTIVMAEYVKPLMMDSDPLTGNGISHIYEVPHMEVHMSVIDPSRSKPNGQPVSLEVIRGRAVRVDAIKVGRSKRKTNDIATGRRNPQYTT